MVQFAGTRTGDAWAQGLEERGTAEALSLPVCSPRVPVSSSGCWSPPQSTIAVGHLQERCNLLSEKGRQDKTQAGHLGSEVLPAFPNASLDLLTMLMIIRQRDG